ncbi:MAG: hypothetical protein ABI566_00955 [Pseudolysinimonas sp.]
MTLRALDGDALRIRPDHSELRIALPWIRSMPLACIHDLVVEIDGTAADVAVLLGERRLSPNELIAEDAWWYLQDRLVLELPVLASGSHDVAVAFDLEVPYLAIGPAPLRLPIRDSRELTDGPVVSRPARQDVA